MPLPIEQWPQIFNDSMKNHFKFYNKLVDVAESLLNAQLKDDMPPEFLPRGPSRLAKLRIPPHLRCPENQMVVLENPMGLGSKFEFRFSEDTDGFDARVITLDGLKSGGRC